MKDEIVGLMSTMMGTNNARLATLEKRVVEGERQRKEGVGVKAPAPQSQPQQPELEILDQSSSGWDEAEDDDEGEDDENPEVPCEPSLPSGAKTKSSSAKIPPPGKAKAWATLPQDIKGSDRREAQSEVLLDLERELMREAGRSDQAKSRPGPKFPVRLDFDEKPSDLTFVPLIEDFRDRAMTLHEGQGIQTDHEVPKTQKNAYRLASDDFAVISPYREVDGFIKACVPNDGSLPVDKAAKEKLTRVARQRGLAVASFRRVNAAAFPLESAMSRLSGAMANLRVAESNDELFHVLDDMEAVYARMAYAYNAVCETGDIHLRWMDRLTRDEKSAWLHAGVLPEDLVRKEVARPLSSGTVERDSIVKGPLFSDDLRKEVRTAKENRSFLEDLYKSQGRKTNPGRGGPPAKRARFPSRGSYAHRGASRGRGGPQVEFVWGNSNYDAPATQSRPPSEDTQFSPKPRGGGGRGVFRGRGGRGFRGRGGKFGRGSRGGSSGRGGGLQQGF